MESVEELEQRRDYKWDQYLRFKAEYEKSLRSDGSEGAKSEWPKENMIQMAKQCELLDNEIDRRKSGKPQIA